jgi:hypothetical protein
MANFYSTNETTALNQATTSAGIQGGNLQIRSIVAAGKLQILADTYTIPASAGPASGDVLNWYPLPFPIATIVYARLFWDALGAGVTVALGKVDPNNSANTDANHYFAPTSAAVAGNATANTNIWEQVGTDPLGDQTTGNTVPQFGSAGIQFTTTFGGGTPSASAVLKLVVFYVTGT